MTPQSESIDLMATAEGLLSERFGFAAFQPGQRAVVQRLLSGRSAVAVFPTGGGKSLCYQLPALVLEGITLVVSPLISLMKDQIDALAARDIRAARLDHSLSESVYAQTLEAARQGQLQLLYVSPERFNNERFRESLQSMTIALMAIDEAHCISEWGHNFRPDYLKLPSYARDCGAQRILALTATATPSVLDDIRRQFDIEPDDAIRTGFYRPNLTLQFMPVKAEDRDVQLRSLLRQQSPGPTIIYVTQQRTADILAARLADEQFSARAYHAGLEAEERTHLQDWFMQSEEAIMVATIAFGMGIDKSDIRYVYHYNLPKSLEGYAQEIGRAGRDRQPATCWLLACSDDRTVLENFIYGDTPTRAAIANLVREVFSHPVEFCLSHYEISNRCDIRILVAQTLLTYLQAEGWIEAGTPYYAEYKFQLKQPSIKILAKFNGERREFLAGIFRTAQLAKTWHFLDVDQAAKQLKSPRERVVRALDYLGQLGELEVKATAMRHRYRRLKAPDNVEHIVDQLNDRIVRRETADLQRIEQVVELIGYDGCQTQRLGQHFGDTAQPPCGHCTWCLHGHRRLTLPPRVDHTIDAAVVRAAKNLVAEHETLFAEPRNIARFLCGLSSPQLIRQKMLRHAMFGCLAHVPFAHVMARFESGSKE